jgi:adenosylcobinamide-phosphate synthase
VSRAHALAAAAALIADRLVPHPRRVPHPVALFGGAMARVEDRVYADDLLAGATYAAIGTVAAAAAGASARSTALTTWISLGGRQLHETAMEIGALLDERDLAGARLVLPSLVGRDPEALDADGISRAVVESVAENTVDAIVAPALWAALGGSAAVFAHRAIDTMDSMVGHPEGRYQRFGTVSARLDDAVAWVPARATVGLVALARPDRAVRVLRTVRRDARAHPSPNAGVAEAAFAAALGVELGGATVYADRTDDRPLMGSGHTPRTEDIGRAVALSQEVATALAAVLAGWGLAGRRR